MRPQTRRPTLISFSGMDGAGKSTQIAALRARLTQAGLQVALITFWDDVACLKGLRETSSHALFGGDKGVGTPDVPIERRDKNIRSWAMTGVRLGLYLIDAISLRRVVAKAAKSSADFVIHDRYIYDELANLNLCSAIARAYVRLIMGIVPRLDMSYVLDAEPSEARARKPEYPLEFLHTCRGSYKMLASVVGGITIVPPLPVDQVALCILQTIAAYLPQGVVLAEGLSAPARS